MVVPCPRRLGFFCVLLFSLCTGVFISQKSQLTCAKDPSRFWKNVSLGLGLPSWRSRGATAAAGGLVRSGSQRLKQLWRPATLWELGDVAGTPSPSPSPCPLAGFRGMSMLGFGKSPPWRQSTSRRMEMGSASPYLDLVWIAPTAF